MTKKETFPTKDQAIILDAVDGMSIKDYATAISKLTGSTAIRFISKIANNRICVYLDSKNSVNKLLAIHNNIEIKNKILSIRPLIIPTQRIIISNVPPIVPHYIIEEIFKKNNIRLCSKISFLRAGLTDAEFSHILSFRRQIYVNVDDAKLIPESFMVSFEDTNYRLFATSDKLICFICKNDGHIAKNCPNTPEENNSSQSSDIYAINTNSQNPEAASSQLSDIYNNDTNPQNLVNTSSQISDNYANSNSQSHENLSHTDNTQSTDFNHKDLLSNQVDLNFNLTKSTESPLPVDEFQDTSQTTPMDIDPTKANKRSLSISSVSLSTSDNNSLVIKPSPQIKTKTNSKSLSSNKKAKTAPKPSLSTMNLIKNLDELLQPAKPILTDNLHILNFNQFKNLLADTLSKKDPTESIITYTNNLPALINLIEEVYILSDRSLRNRLHRLTKKLNRIISTTMSDSESDKELSYSTD